MKKLCLSLLSLSLMLTNINVYPMGPNEIVNNPVIMAVTERSKEIAHQDLKENYPGFNDMPPEEKNKLLMEKQQYVFDQFILMALGHSEDESSQEKSKGKERVGGTSTSRASSSTDGHDYEKEAASFASAELKRFTKEKTNLTQEQLDCTIAASPPIIEELIGCIRHEGSVAAIFTGESGGQKTTLAEAIAKRMNIDYIIISSGSVEGQYRASATTNIANIFQAAYEKKKRFIIIFDEIDRLLVSKDGKATKISGEMQVRLDECADKHHNVTVLGTTNHASKLSAELKRRFVIIDKPLPNEEHYKGMIRSSLEKTFLDHTFEDYQIDQLNRKLSRRPISKLAQAARLVQGRLYSEVNKKKAEKKEAAASSSSTSTSTRPATYITPVPADGKKDKKPDISKVKPQTIVDLIDSRIQGYYSEKWDTAKSGVGNWYHDHRGAIWTGVSVTVIGAGILGAWKRGILFSNPQNKLATTQTEAIKAQEKRAEEEENRRKKEHQMAVEKHKAAMEKEQREIEDHQILVNRATEDTEKHQVAMEEAQQRKEKHASEMEEENRKATIFEQEQYDRKYKQLVDWSENLRKVLAEYSVQSWIPTRGLWKGNYGEITSLLYDLNVQLREMSAEEFKKNFPSAAKKLEASNDKKPGVTVKPQFVMGNGPDSGFRVKIGIS